MQPPVWKLVALIEMGDRLAATDTFTDEKMLDFLTSLSRFEDFPENVSYNHIKKLSGVIQDSVLNRLETVEDQKLLFQLHKFLCLSLIVIFKKRQAWNAFKWVNSSLARLALSAFWEDKEHCTPEHAAVIRECGKVFLRRM